MLTTEKIVKQLSQEHAALIRQRLMDQSPYKQYSLAIFDGYRDGKAVATTQDSLKLDEKAYKVFDRIVFRAILAFYEVEDKTPRDIILTTIFYAINGAGESTKKEKSQELESLFHQLKKYGLESISANLLAELKNLHQGSPLEAVYQHLFDRYATEAEIATKALERFKSFNKLISSSLLSESNTKALIKQYKSIRKLKEKQDGLITNSIFQLAKLSLVTIAEQEQLLKEHGESKGMLLDSCSRLIQRLPFGMLKFYMQNIFEELKIILLIKEGDLNAAEMEIKLLGIKRIQANNLNFSNEYVLRYSTQKNNRFSKALQYLNIDPLNWEFVQNKPHYGGARLSSS